MMDIFFGRSSPVCIKETSPIGELSGTLREQQFLSGRECGSNLLPRNGWKIDEELIDSMTSLQIIEKRSGKNARSTEAGCSAHNLWIGKNR